MMPFRNHREIAVLGYAVVLVCLLPTLTVGQSMGEGMIAGTALDSLRRHPLTGALITVEGVGRSAVTDRDGYFRIDSVPAGSRRLNVFHPLLDSLGLTLISPMLDVPRDTTVHVVVATPSPSAFLSIVCGNDSLAALVGMVSRADEAMPPENASVLLAWTETEISSRVGIRHARRSVAADVDPMGRFRLCGIPPDVHGQAVAISGSDTSGVMEVVFESSPVAVLKLVLPGSDVVVAPLEADTSLTLQSQVSGADTVATRADNSLVRGRASVSGIISDSSGTPLANARVSLYGALGAAVTDSSGRFVLRDQPSGSGRLVARKLGFGMVEIPVHLTVAEPASVRIVMEPAEDVAVLAEVVVRARFEAGLASVGFSQRKRRGAGHFMTSEDIERRITHNLVDVLADLPMLHLISEGGNKRRVVGRRRSVGYNCVKFYVDGLLWSEPAPTEFLSASEVGAIEVYSMSNVPIQFQSVGANTEVCDTVVIWTKNRIIAR